MGDLSEIRAMLTEFEGVAEDMSLPVRVQSLIVLHEIHRLSGSLVVSPREPQSGRIYERLTDKENEVLGHLSELLTTEEIAGVMFISVNTVRTHVRNILRKLASSHRNEAIRRARSMRILAD